MNLPVIPDIDTHDNTKLSAFKKCRRFYYFRHVRHLVSKHGSSAALEFGKLLHRGLEIWYKTRDPRAALEAIEAFPFNEPVDDYRTRGRALLVIARFIENYGIEKDLDILFTETSFNLEDEEGFRYGGRCDLGYKDNSGVWVEDFKSTSMDRHGYFQEWEVSAQMGGYAWGGSQLHGAPIKGIVLHRLLVRKNDEAFLRRPILYPEWKMVEWREQTIITYHQIAEAFEKESFPPNWDACSGKYGFCPFHKVCKAAPGVRGKLLNSEFKEEPWDWQEDD